MQAAQRIAEFSRVLRQNGFLEGNHSEPGHYVIEKAFVEK